MEFDIYAMEFWMKIKSVQNFLNGLYVIWKGHVSINAYTDTQRN